MLLFIFLCCKHCFRFIRFNTSHVVIYPLTEILVGGAWEFQYISCCYLSSTQLKTVTPKERFNTSHVVIYLENTNMLGDKNMVSIHLMLLFIGKLELEKISVKKFQYISCCYLSLIYNS